jgi:hypothetical protein
VLNATLIVPLVVALSLSFATVARQDLPWLVVPQLGYLPRWVVIPLIFRFGAIRRWMFRTISQIGIHYHGSPLSTGRAGHVRGGDRLPWVPSASSRESDNHAPLSSLDWQVHVYGKPGDGVAKACAELGFSLHEFAWRAEMARVGLQRGALYLVRPDGYIGLADSAGEPQRLRDYVANHSTKL